MIQLSILIVEDQSTARELIKHSVEKYNSASKDVHFTIVGEAHSYEGAVEVILREEENITLVLLDIKLVGKKTGYDVIRRFPDLSYAIISDDREAGTKAINDLSNANIYFFQNKEGGSPDVDDIINGIEKFVSAKNKGGGFYSKKIKVNGNTIYWKKVALISKSLLYLNDDKIIEACPVCSIPPKDRIHFYSNSTQEIGGADKHKHLLLSNSFSNTDYSITHFIEKARLNPNDFIKISQSTIVNLNYVKDFRQQAGELYLDILDGNNHLLAIPKSVKDYFKTDDVLDKINHHLP